MTHECDNVSNLHDFVIVEETSSAMRVYCKICKHQKVVRKDINKNVPEKRAYARLFKRDIVQPHEPLYYKVFPTRMNVAG